MVAPRPPLQYEKLGTTEGVGCLSSWLPFPFTSSVTVGFRGRFERARAEALEKIPGATALVDVEIQETTTYWPFGATDCMTVRGTAIR